MLKRFFFGQLSNYFIMSLDQKQLNQEMMTAPLIVYEEEETCGKF
jgi:hypothetical protein